MSTMTPTDAVNVLNFLERTRAQETNPEGVAMLQRVEDHLSAWVSKATSKLVNDGGPAFPFLELEQSTGMPYHQNQGMTLRDYFAAKATDEDVRDQGEILRAEMVSASGIGILPDGWRTTARYMHADAMLKARSA